MEANLTTPVKSPLFLEYPVECNEWKQKIDLNIEQGKYQIKTAQCVEDFKRVLKLRREVFLLEFAQMSEEEAGHDFESYDMESDFLMIMNKRTGELLGTYRMICSTYSEKFYSSSEFNIDELISMKGTKLELSRACVGKDHRSGIMIHLLWKGIAEYLIKSKAKYMFGCCSLTNLELANVVEVYNYLHDHEGLGSEFEISVRQNYNIISLDGIISKKVDSHKPKGVVPAFLQSYIHAGAKVYGAPAYDQAFHCLISLWF